MKEYISYIKEHGQPLSLISPNSTEFALTSDDVFAAIDLISKEGKYPILGGDILTLNSENKLTYAYQVWGSEYHVLNWYCEKIANEDVVKYIARSYVEAKSAINTAIESSHELNRPCYFVLVL